MVTVGGVPANTKIWGPVSEPGKYNLRDIPSQMYGQWNE